MRGEEAQDERRERREFASELQEKKRNKFSGCYSMEWNGQEMKEEAEGAGGQDTANCYLLLL